MNGLKGRHWLIPALLIGTFFAAAALAASDSQPAPVAPERPPAFDEAAAIPLLEVLEARRGVAIGWPGDGFLASPETETGPEPGPARPVVIRFADPADVSPPLPPAIAAVSPSVSLRSQSPAPDPLPTAIAEALARLILHDPPVNPLGEGDWRAARAAIGAFYADRQFEPVWVDKDGLTRAGRSALRQLERAAEDGLDLSSVSLPRDLKPTSGPAELAETEAAIAAAVVAYAAQASGSRVEPIRISRLITAAPDVADPGGALAETAAAPDPAARLQDFNPPQKGYRDLRDELNRLTETPPDRLGRGAGAKLDLGPDPAQALAGARADFAAEPRIEDARKRVKAPARNRAYTASANPARSGPSHSQRAAILANMEMWRWEPREMGERRIEVNIADYSVSVLEGDTVIHHARVVVGKPNTPTPIFSNTMRYVLINPSWRVPDSIIRKEMLPRYAADPDYFSRHGYEVKTVGGRLTVRQPPGDRNALGRIAFMFPNDHSVYLHDTPSQALFDEEKRAFSHGCIRVEDPVRLAELVLGWPESRINAAIGGHERTVFLPRPLPIHIEYFTEFVDEFGELQERPDVYGLAQRVADILSVARQD